MNNIRQIITERLDNARNDYDNKLSKLPSYCISELAGQIEAYQDCLNLMQPRTEADILKDFEVIKYRIYKNDEHSLMMVRGSKVIHIIKPAKLYRKYDKKSLSSLVFDMQEHKLLNELFEVWQWI